MIHVKCPLDDMGKNESCFGGAFLVAWTFGMDWDFICFNCSSAKFSRAGEWKSWSKLDGILN